MSDWTGRLVVATPQLTDPNFARTVVLLLQSDDEDGALGLVLNRPTGTEVGEVLDMWHPLAAEPGVVFTGGPVQPSAAICLGHGRPGAPAVASYSVLEGSPGTAFGTVDLDASPSDVATAVTEVRVFAGYAGWAAGQLEAEVEEGSWWVLDALPSDAFTDRPELLWHQVLRRQGAPIAFAASYPENPALN
ncbi:MAG: putative transcriptional regulator [Actinomycetota bacterium]|jgi:putative transcriptional regulator|nr:putative transcriptional regulator [Actinomycetota bacterium]